MAEVWLSYYKKHTGQPRISYGHAVEALPVEAGPTLPNWEGDLADMPGAYFAKILEQLWTGEVPTASYWTPTRLVEDTRLAARATHVSRYSFAASAEDEITVTAQLIFRRAYYTLMQQKNWDAADILMEEVIVRLFPAHGD